MAETIGTRLRRSIDQAALSMRRFAESAALPYRSLQSYASDEQKPGAEALVKIRSNLNVNIDWLLTGEGDQFVAGTKRLIRPATMGDIFDLCERLEMFEDHEKVLQLIVLIHSSGKRLLETKAQIDRMSSAFESKHGRDYLDKIDYRALTVAEFQDLYSAEFGEAALGGPKNEGPN